jgi:hypothetical protein
MISADTGVNENVGGLATVKNSHPIVTAVDLDPADRIYRGVDITAIPKGMDPDGDSIEYRYQWVINGEEIASGDKSVLPGDRFQKGDLLTVYVTPYDQDGEGETTKPRPIVIPNAPPKITSAPPVEFRSLIYNYQVTAEDPDGDPVTFSLAAGPEGMTIDTQTGKLTWEIHKDQAGEQAIEVVAEDDQEGKFSQKYTISINLPE